MEQLRKRSLLSAKGYNWKLILFKARRNIFECVVLKFEKIDLERVSY